MTVRPRKAPPAAAQSIPEDLRRLVRQLVDPNWYLKAYPDVAQFKGTPVTHFTRHGLSDLRDPNCWFDGAWYLAANPDVEPTGAIPLTHYLRFGVPELRDPGPDFDATFYTEMHPEAAANPLLFHHRTGHQRGYATEWRVTADDYQPSQRARLVPPRAAVADVILLGDGSPDRLRRCLERVRAGGGAHLGRVFVPIGLHDKRDTPPWLRVQEAEGLVTSIRRPRRGGEAALIEAAIKAAGDHDIVLLNTAVDVPEDWLTRLAAQAYADQRVASVSPFSDAAGWNGFPSKDGGVLLFGLPAEAIDQACRTLNTARAAIVPALDKACAYVRRDLLRTIGPPGGRGFAEDDWPIEFSLRAARAGWQNRVACDMFVRSADAARGFPTARDSASLCRLYPDYPSRLLSHQRRDRAGPFRFAVVASLLVEQKLPVIAMVTHLMGGGVRSHMETIAARIQGKAQVVFVEGWVTERAGRPVTDMRLSLPIGRSGHIVSLAADQVDEAVAMLRRLNVSRVHIHHLLWFEFDTRAMVRRLGVPLDVTVHDNYAICTQLNMLPQATSFYCGGPDIATCNACIAISPSANQARDILSWRLRYAWQFAEADRIFCPSQDMKQRLMRYGLAEHALVVPHEPVAASDWSLVLPTLAKGPLRVVLLGQLANHKGSRIVAPVVETAAPGTLQVHCIGEIEATFPPQAASLLTSSGRYQEQELPDLIRQAKPHVIWLPSVAPESYSYTLSAAIEAGLPIVATRFGAFPERLEGRPFTWLVEHDAPVATWLDTFRQVRAALERPPAKLPRVARTPVADFYAEQYLVADPVPRLPHINRGAKPVVSVVAERFDSGHLSPCAFIRLLQPLTHPEIGGDFAMVLDDAESVLGRQADIIVTQRHAIPDRAAADALAAQARRVGASLVYDLDDDLLTVPPSHPDATTLRPKARVVRHMLEQADRVSVASTGLMQRLATIRHDAVLVPNGLDERIWAYGPTPPRWQPWPLRILCMGSTTHERDLALILPALERLAAECQDRVVIDIIGMTPVFKLPDFVRRIVPPFFATQSYPAFVHWINAITPGWHIGLAPLADTGFNRCKSPIKAMDYAALGLAVLASDVPAYRGSLADGEVGQLVPNDPNAWLDALSWLVRDQVQWRDYVLRSRQAFLAQASLTSQATTRRANWLALLDEHAGIPAGPACGEASRR
ncbi:MAG: glycosyltransferase [Acetobacteraceae bacterium]